MASPAPRPRPDAGDIALAYHARTKHRRDAYARGPDTIDWTEQPDPFRTFAGADRVPLPFGADKIAVPYADLFTPGAVAPCPLSLESVGLLLELSFAISAWKELGPDRWALRCTPSSGNLHPTEAYVLCRDLPGLADGVHHYVSRDHALERRFAPDSTIGGNRAPGLWLGLSSIHWREAWKYGERAFRYCQLDIGHALGALRLAAAALGWRIALVESCGATEIAALLGLDRGGDFLAAEREDAELLLQVVPAEAAATPFAPLFGAGTWAGRANLLDPHPMYHWPVIDEVAEATAGGGLPHTAPGTLNFSAPMRRPDGARATKVILGRRSAQRFDTTFQMAKDDFFRILDATLARATAPWDIWSFAPRLHLLLLVHRVDGLEPGVYTLVRRPGALAHLKAALDPTFLWLPAEGAPEHLPLHQLTAGDCRKAARMLSCLQAIAADSCFTMGMLAEFAGTVTCEPWRYRQLHWEAGLIGQALYLEAEALGLNGTGIGCFYDDDVHAATGIKGDGLQSLYHFTIGRALTDERILTLPPYPGRAAPNL